MADEQPVPELTYAEAVAQGYIVPETTATPTPQAELRQGGGIDMVDLSQYGYVPGAIGSGYNYGASALNSIGDWMKERESQETNPILSGLLSMPRTTVEDVSAIPELAGRAVGEYGADRYLGKTDLEAKMNLVNSFLPEGKRVEAAGSALGTGLGMMPQLKPLKGPVLGTLKGLEKSILPYIGSVLGGEAANQGEQLVGMAPDTPFGSDMSEMVREGVAHSGSTVPMTPARNIVGGMSRGVEAIASKRAIRTSALLDKDLNRAQALFDNPTEAVTRQGQPMVEALKEPSIQPIFENLPKSLDPKFNLWTTIKERLKGKDGKGGEIGKTGAEIGDIISSLPPEATVSVRSIWESPKWVDLELQTKGGSGGATARIVDGVLKEEKKAMAGVAQSAGILTEKQAYRYKNLLDKDARARRGQGSSMLANSARGMLTPNEKTLLGWLENKIKNVELSPTQAREMKTRHDSFAKYDSMSDADALSRADIYKDIGGVFRDRLQNVIKRHDPALLEKFQAANKRYGILMDVEPAVMSRENAVNLKGAQTPVGGFQAVEGRGGEATNASLYPEIDTPEVRLYRASEMEGEAPGRAGLAIGNIVNKLEALGARGVNKYATLSNKAFNSPPVAGYMGGRAAQDATPMVVPLGVNDIYSVPEGQLPPQLQQDAEFMKIHKDGGDMTEENQLRQLSDYLIGKGSENKQFFQRSPYVGYTTVKDSKGYWRIMDDNQRDAFANDIIRSEKDPIMQAKKLKALNENGRIIEGGRVDTSSKIDPEGKWATPHAKEVNVKPLEVTGFESSDPEKQKDAEDGIYRYGISTLAKLIKKGGAVDDATKQKYLAQLSARKASIDSRPPSLASDKEMMELEELEEMLGGMSTTNTINGKRQEPDF